MCIKIIKMRNLKQIFVISSCELSVCVYYLLGDLVEGLVLGGGPSGATPPPAAAVHCGPSRAATITPTTTHLSPQTTRVTTTTKHNKPIYISYNKTGAQNDPVSRNNNNNKPNITGSVIFLKRNGVASCEIGSSS